MPTSVFGISIKYEAWNHQDSLPIYITGICNELVGGTVQELIDVPYKSYYNI